MQALLAGDNLQKVDFCNWLLGRVRQDEDFVSRVLWTYEANFSRDRSINLRNSHCYAVENSHNTHEQNNQQWFSVNLWKGNLKNHVVGLIKLSKKLNGKNFYIYIYIFFF